MVEAGHAVGAFDSRDWIGLVDVPTAVVITERDKTVLPIRQRALADAIDGSVTFLVNGRHDVCATQPEIFVPALTSACFDVAGRIITAE
jgi:3-oxoadipate enol-lactonase